MSETNNPLVPQNATELPLVDVREGAFGVRGAGDTSGFGGLIRRIYLLPAATRPLPGWFEDVVASLEQALAAKDLKPTDVIERVIVDRNELTINIHRNHLLNAMKLLRDEPRLRFEMSTGVNGVHYPHQAYAELHAVYHLRSMTHNRQIRVEATAPDVDPHIPSTVAIYPTNNWHERETYDFFGIIFDGHPALTRIEMPDDWVGHPQRKDYPLGGVPVEYKGATIPAPDERRMYSK